MFQDLSNADEASGTGRGRPPGGGDSGHHGRERWEGRGSVASTHPGLALPLRHIHALEQQVRGTRMDLGLEGSSSQAGQASKSTWISGALRGQKLGCSGQRRFCGGFWRGEWGPDAPLQSSMGWTCRQESGFLNPYSTNGFSFDNYRLHAQ